tara:strand:- start:526 stop:711 length:186 start_codon:yes stop_codon:yes gene_type:complete
MQAPWLPPKVVFICALVLVPLVGHALFSLATERVGIHKEEMKANKNNSLPKFVFFDRKFMI